MRWVLENRLAAVLRGKKTPLVLLLGQVAVRPARLAVADHAGACPIAIDIDIDGARDRGERDGGGGLATGHFTWASAVMAARGR